MPRKSVPKYGHHKPTGQARVVLGGRHIYLGAYGSKASRELYLRLLGEWEATGRAVAPGKKRQRVAVVQIILAYVRWCRGRYTGSTLGGIKSALRVLRELYSRLPADEFAPLHLQVVRRRMIDDRKWARSTVNGGIHRITHLFRWAGANGLVSPTVYAGLKTVGGLRRGELGVREGDPRNPGQFFVVDRGRVTSEP